MNQNISKMARKKKKTTRRKSTKKRSRSTRKKIVKSPPRDKQPSYMVRVGEPKSVRKDVLESLREVILIMQAYEEFKRIQAEKKIVFAQLKDDVKELNNMIDNRLRFYLPKGKLTLALKKEKIQEDQRVKLMRESVAKVTPKVVGLKAKAVPVAPKKSEKGLEDLEMQLASIEKQLGDM